MSNPTKGTYNFPVIPLPGGWKIETWYNRQASSWVSQLKDASGNQVGDAEYDGHADCVRHSRETLQRRYTVEFPGFEDLRLSIEQLAKLDSREVVV